MYFCTSETTFTALRRLLFILPLMFLGQLICGQEITLHREADGGGLAVDPDYIWRYNLYEHSRWGLGLAYNSDWNSSWRVVANAGYGLRDQQLKWGVGASFLLDSIHDGRLYFMATREYATAGNRSFRYPTITDIGGLASFMSLRMSDQHSVLVGYKWRTKIVDYRTDVRLFRGGRLFDGYGPLYRKDGDSIAPENGLELSFNFISKYFRGNLVMGHTWPAQKPIVQLVGEYDRTFRIGLFDFRCYSQVGATPPNTPYIYMFDLGGSYGSPLFFRETLLTARPVEYTANCFVFGSLRFSLRKPLYNVYSHLFAVGSNPRPFAGLNAVWGDMWRGCVMTMADGSLVYEGLFLQPPDRGVMELFVGIDGLVRWGVADYGVAFALRPWPLEDGKPRCVLLFTAELVK